MLVHNVTLRGDYALGFTPNGLVVPGTHLWREDVLQSTIDTVSGEPNIGRLIGTAVSTVSVWSRNYFHFLFEVLPLLLNNFGELDCVFLPPKPPPYILAGAQYSDYYGRMLEWDAVDTFVENLIVPEPTRKNGFPTQDTVDLLRTLIPPNSKPMNKIYVSRSDAPSRNVPNEEIVPDDYMTLVCSELSLCAQIVAFSKASVIVGAHGAGLSNMIWAPRGCKVIEFYKEPRNLCYEKLALSLDFCYVGIECDELLKAAFE